MQAIEKAVALKSDLDGLWPLDKEQEVRIMQKFRLDWNYHSNHIEGNTLTFGETKALILHGITAGSKPLKDHLEVTGHNEAINWVLDVVKGEHPLTEKFIRELHSLLLKEPYEARAITPEGNPTTKKITVGAYKTTPNHVRTATGEMFWFATPEETPAKMYDLINWYREREITDIEPILLAAEFHYRFIRIHPFDDGNGRTARILMNFVLMKHVYPPAIIKTEDKEHYFFALRQADAGTIAPFIEYVAENVVRSLEIMIAGAKGESIEEPDDFDKEIALLDHRLKGLGNKITVKKTNEILLEIYDDSITGLISEYIHSSEKFERFYVENEFVLFMNNQSIGTNKYNVISETRNRLDKELKSMTLNYSYRYFSYSDIGEFNYDSSIYIIFDVVKYKVESSRHSLQLERRYNEQLTAAEIKELVKGEMQAHKSFIEDKIERASETDPFGF